MSLDLYNNMCMSLHLYNNLVTHCLWPCPCLSVCLSLSVSLSLSMPTSTPVCPPLSLSLSPLTPGITSTCQGQDLTCLKLAYPSLERPFWNYLPQNIKSCASLPSFKRNLHKYIMFEKNLWSKLERFV